MGVLIFSSQSGDVIEASVGQVKGKLLTQNGEGIKTAEQHLLKAKQADSGIHRVVIERLVFAV